MKKYQCPGCEADITTAVGLLRLPDGYLMDLPLGTTVSCPKCGLGVRVLIQEDILLVSTGYVDPQVHLPLSRAD